MKWVKKTIVLFEVILVVALILLISLFLLRGYSLFMKTGRRNLDYIKLVMLSEERLWELQMEEQKEGVLADLERRGSIDPSFIWQVESEDTDYEGLRRIILNVGYEGEKKGCLDTVLYFLAK